MKIPKNIQEVIYNNEDYKKTNWDNKNFRVWGIGLIGKLKIEGFLQNISSLEITNCGIEELDISECVNLQEIFLANNNSLTNFNFLRQLPYPAKLKSFTVMNTIMNERTDIEIFQPFINLEVLRIKICRNLDFEKEGKTYHNSFFGSLESLKNLKKLKWLDISDTDIDNGWKHLPASLEHFFCGPCVRDNPRSKIIFEQLQNYPDFWEGSNFKFKLWKQSQEVTQQKDKWWKNKKSIFSFLLIVAFTGIFLTIFFKQCRKKSNMRNKEKNVL